MTSLSKSKCLPLVAAGLLAIGGCFSSVGEKEIGSDDASEDTGAADVASDTVEGGDTDEPSPDMTTDTGGEEPDTEQPDPDTAGDTFEPDTTAMDTGSETMDTTPMVEPWTRLIGTSGRERAKGVATDSSGNVFVGGSTSEDLGGETNSGGTDGYLAKFDRDGNRQWVKLLGTADDESIEGVATDSAGAIYVVGATAGDVDAGDLVADLTDEFGGGGGGGPTFAQGGGLDAAPETVVAALRD